MNLCRSCFLPPPHHQFRTPTPFRSLYAPCRLFSIRCNVPFPAEKTKFRRELQAAVDVVQRACRLCVEVKRSLLSNGDGGVVEKNDQTPVTIADFGVQALVSLELGNLFPSIPLVAEEDSSYLRTSFMKPDENGNHGYSSLVESILKAVTNNVSCRSLSCGDVLQAIDRGGKSAHAFGSKPATYWVLDPIDGTRGFLRGTESLYVVGLALVVEGSIVLGVMGCPNWKTDFVSDREVAPEDAESENHHSGLGIIMAAQTGCGTWMKRTSDFSLNIDTIGLHDCWMRCFVDKCVNVDEAKFCIPDSQSWDSLPLSTFFVPTTDSGNNGRTTDSGNNGRTRQVVLLPTCCGSLCKYLMVASGRASVFILRARAQTVIKVWDHAVGMICVHEAGGKIGRAVSWSLLQTKRHGGSFFLQVEC
ncbi:putative PAP-specific phosphatase, mitochondrial isoform X2 [Nymphaea colorata]|uniref:putative PAP-specific phosphatase, mitochondrial isoform X2 n=1 Tax=Nymphaea colorata TaxID=210225 RepID=UPI00129EFC80|nr:putative PAP-specific phosphatase, mitochondrial isoform X2 [Nymphaea colorata]